MTKIINVIILNANVLPQDRPLLFGLEDVWEMPVGTTFADILVKAGIFKSKSDAKRNGWDKPIPDGWSEFTVGKLKHQISIWNPFFWEDPGDET